MKRSVCLLVILTMFFIPFRSAAASGAFLIMDGNTGLVLESENGESPLPMASTTKVMTALVVLENTKLRAKVRIPAEAVGIEGSSLYIKQNEVYTVEELLYGLLLRSANDCAAALAWYAGGMDSVAFISMMNEKAAALSLRNTHFANPHGLSAEGHYTSARDLAVIMREAMKNEEFRRISSMRSATVQGNTIQNHNRLLSLYEYCVGGKTGYTMEAGRCLVTAAEKEGALLICVTLGRRDDWNIHTSAYERWFSETTNVVLAEKGTFTYTFSLAGGGTVTAENASEISALLFRYRNNAESRVLGSHMVYGNKAAGDVVGTVEFWVDGTKIGESPLVLQTAVETKIEKKLFIARIFLFFRRLFLKI